MSYKPKSNDFFTKKQNEKALVSRPEVGFQDFGKRKLRYSGVGPAVRQVSTITVAFLFGFCPADIPTLVTSSSAVATSSEILFIPHTLLQSICLLPTTDGAFQVGGNLCKIVNWVTRRSLGWCCTSRRS